MSYCDPPVLAPRRGAVFSLLTRSVRHGRLVDAYPDAIDATRLDNMARETQSFGLPDSSTVPEDASMFLYPTDRSSVDPARASAEREGLHVRGPPQAWSFALFELYFRRVDEKEAVQ
jgi:hypothetical protein